MPLYLYPCTVFRSQTPIGRSGNAVSVSFLWPVHGADLYAAEHSSHTALDPRGTSPRGAVSSRTTHRNSGGNGSSSPRAGIETTLAPFPWAPVDDRTLKRS